MLPCQRNNGRCEHICANTLNGAVCSCRKGYSLFFGVFCAGTNHSYCIATVYLYCIINITTEINECTLYKGICGTDKNCINTPGDYLCLCKTGFQQFANGSCQGMNYIKHPS